jgi:valyl-tRNA synthetase
VELIKRRLHVPQGLTNKELKDAEDDQRMVRQVLAKVLKDLLVMLHPLMPHLTEELWHGLRGETINNQEEVFNSKKFVALQRWPTAKREYIDKSIENSFGRVIDVIRLARSLRAEAGIKPSKSARLRIVIDSSAEVSILCDALDDIKTLAKASHVEVLQSDADSPRQRCIAAVSGRMQVLLLLDDELMDLGAFRERLEKSYLEAKQEFDSLDARLKNPGFIAKAPQAVVAECSQRLSEASSQMDLAKKRLADLD